MKYLLFFCFSWSLVLSVNITSFSYCGNYSYSEYFFTSSTVMITISDQTAYRIDLEAKTCYSIAESIQQMFQFACDPQMFIMQDSYNNYLYTSTDGGLSVTQAQEPTTNTPYSYVFHPTQPGWIAAFASEQDATGYYTTNLGQYWDPFTGTFPDVSSVAWSLNPNTPNLFFAFQTGPDLSLMLSFTKNYGMSWRGLLSDAVAFTLTTNFMFVAVMQDDGYIQLWASSAQSDPTHTNLQYYIRCDFPASGDIYGYQVIEDYYSPVFIGLEYNNSFSGNLYTSEFNGVYYTMVMENATLLAEFDFAATSLPGIYIANQATDSFYTQQTFITFDNGGEWRLLAPPEVDMNGKSFNCTQNCSLHLHPLGVNFGRDQVRLPPIANSLGIIVGAGNVGPYLSFETGSIFLSTDAGLTWKQLWNDTAEYFIGDNGGLIALIIRGNNETLIYYTTDLGGSFNMFTLNNISVSAVYFPPEGVKFMLYVTTIAYWPVSPSSYIIELDFGDEFSSTCNIDTDYEYWTPTDGAHDDVSCFLGATTVYLRKKTGVNCINNINTTMISQKPCPCAWEDYECAPGFLPSRRNSTNGFTCTLANNATSSIPCNYGYQLIPVTLCTLYNGLDLLNCSSSSTITSGSTSTIGNSTTYSTVTATSTSSSSSASSSSSTTSSTSSSPSTTSPTPAPSTSMPATSSLATSSSSSSGNHKTGEGVGFTVLFGFLGGLAGSIVIIFIVLILLRQCARCRQWVLNQNGGYAPFLN